MTPRRKALVLPVVAAAAFTTPLIASADSGFYIGGSVGSATLEEDFEGFRLDADNTAYRFVAGWQLSDLLSLEAGYKNFGSFDDSVTVGGEPVDVSIEADGWMLGGTASLPLGPALSLYGRAGAFIWDADAEVNSIIEGRTDDTNPYYGAGAKVAIGERLDLIGDWTRYELDSTESDVISLGFTLRF